MTASQKDQSAFAHPAFGDKCSFHGLYSDQILSSLPLSSYWCHLLLGVIHSRTFSAIVQVTLRDAGP